MSYPIPNNQVESLVEIKKSKFIATACFCESREHAMSHLASVKAKFPDARHHCWAYMLGDPSHPKSAAMDDDGEPSGTAGKPILNVLQHKNIGDIMVIVTRYFGGIKLGAGGLVRAYSAATQQAIDQLKVKQQIEYTSISILVDYPHEQHIRHLTAKVAGEIIDCTYQNTVSMGIKIPNLEVNGFKECISPYVINFVGNDTL